MSLTAITPYLTVPDAKEAIAWYQKVFDATQPERNLEGPDGSTIHGMIQIGDGHVMLSDHNPDWGTHTPAELGGTPVRINVVFPNVDEVAKLTEENGGKILEPVADQFYGMRAGRIQDPFGHVWIISQWLEEISADEMQRRFDEMTKADS